MKKYLLLLSLGIATITTDSSAMFKKFIGKIKNNLPKKHQSLVKTDSLQNKNDNINNINLLSLGDSITHVRECMLNEQGAIYVEYDKSDASRPIKEKINHWLDCNKIGLDDIDYSINQIDFKLNSKYPLPSFFDPEELIAVNRLKATLEDSKNNITIFQQMITNFEFTNNNLSHEQLEEQALLLTNKLQLNNNRLNYDINRMSFSFWNQIRKAKEDQQNHE